MLKVILLEKAKDLYPLEFLLNPDIPTTLVLPNPSLADDLRERFLDKEVDLITISRFVKNELMEEREDKAHLIFDLLKCYKKNFAQPSFEKFLHSFNQFTDLRSFTLSYSLIEEVLSQFDEEVAKALTLFWKEVTDKSLIDEHSSYFQIAEKFKDHKENLNKKNIIFYGFNHLNPLQVEMIQSLAIHYNVYIPFLKRVYLKSHSSDWIKWIDTTFDFKEEVVEDLEAKGKKAFYPENKMAEFLSLCPIDPKNKKVDFYILSKNLDFNQVNEIPLKALNFKVKNDLFSSKLKTFFESIETVEDIEACFKEESTKAFDQLDFRLLKIISLVKENLKYFEKILDRFDLKALEYVVSLKLPRTYTTPLISKDFIGEIRGRGSLLSYEPQNLNIIIFPSEDHSISIGSAKYPKQVEEFLLSLGPVQNPFLEFLNTQEILREIFEDESALLVAEYGSDETNDAVEQIISKLKITKNLEVEFGSSYVEPKDHLEKYIEKSAKAQRNLSATKLQTYLDCPRKYYFSYINKVQSPPTQETFSYLQLGNIEHSIIGKYLEKNEVFIPEVFQTIVAEEFEKFILENNMQPSILEKESALIEVRDYSLHGVTELIKLKNIFPGSNLGFEKELMQTGDLPANGRLDVILTSNEEYALLDFKRGSVSIGSKNQLLDFKKIQPWFYLNHYPMEGKNCLFLGYVNLSDPKESLVYCSDKSVADRLEQGNFQGEFFFGENKKISDIIKEFAEFEKVKFNQMNIEKNFLAKPLDSKVCDYCRVNQICPKDGSANVIA